MFETFYELGKTPFSRDIATDQLYSSMMLEEILGRLEYAAQRQLFAVITGDCGTGKTTIIRKFKDYLVSAQFMVPGRFTTYPPAFLQRHAGTAGL